MRFRASGISAGAALALALAAGGARAAVPIDELRVEMRPLDARVLFRKDPYDKSSFPVTVIDGERRLSGRIEVKGSFTRVTGKKSVLIKLEDGTWRGGARISLNGMGTDPSMMREWLAWELMRALRLVIPDTGYTRLSINGEDRGLFLRIEWIDPKMLDRFGLGADGDFYHPLDSTHCGDLTPVSLDPARRCWLKLAPRDAPDLASLERMIAELVAEPVDHFDRFIGRSFDGEALVNWYAVNGLVSETDTYNKNYFLYLSRASGRWVVVPWDYDLTFGRAYDPYVLFPYTILNDRFQYHYPLESGQSNPLHYQALKNAPFRRRVLERVRELIEGTPDAARPWRGWFAPERMARRLDELQAALRPEVRRDPFMVAAPERFEDEVEAVRFFARAHVRFLQRTLFDAGNEWLRDEASAPLPAAGREVDLVDGWGYLLAGVRPQRGGGRVHASVRRGWPELVPPGADRAACVQRTWLVRAAAAVTADVTVAYLDENSASREPGRAVADERGLYLFAREPDGRWRALPTRVAPLANTLTARDVRLPAGAPLRLVACVAHPVRAAAAP